MRQAHHDLGFARIGDYARERLGISTSQLYELAQVATSLASLSLIEDALTRGNISWTKARELAAVAAPDTQEQWLTVAAQCTADELQALIASWRATAAAAAARATPAREVDGAFGNENPGAGSADDEDIDDEPAVNVVIRCPQAVRLLWWQALRFSSQVAGCELPAWRSAEFIAAEGLSETGWPLETFIVPWMEPRYSKPRNRAVSVHPPAVSIPDPCDPRARAQRDHLSRRSARASAMTAKQLDESMRAVIARMQRIDADLGMLLCRMADGRLHGRLGYNDLGAYCRNALGISTRKVRAMIAIERMRRRTGSSITRAYRSGLLSWHRCLVLLPVLTARTADAWIERGQQVTARRLADEVMWSRMACDAGFLPEPAPPQLGARLEPDFSSFVQFRGSFVGADATTSTANGDEASVPEANDGASGFASVLLDAEIRFRAPVSVADMLRAAIFARLEPHEPVWRGLQRVLEHALAFWMTAPKHRDPVFARDGWRCAVPACSSRRNLHDHHVKFRSQGGGQELDNRVAVCASHHHHGIHRGVLRATGKADVGLDWELGCGRTTGPLLCVSGRGEIYVPASPDAAPVTFTSVERAARLAGAWM